MRSGGRHAMGGLSFQLLDCRCGGAAARVHEAADRKQRDMRRRDGRAIATLQNGMHIVG